MSQVMEKRMRRQTRSYEEVMLQAVDEALKELGENAREVIYLEVARNHGIQREEIPAKFNQFILALRSEFGNSSKTIEALILEKLFGKTGSGDKFQKAVATMVLLTSERKHDRERET